MSREEKRRAWVWAVVLAAALSLPYLAAWGITPEDRTYLGHIWNPDEPNVYYAWMRQASEGQLFLQDLFTTEPQEGRFTNLLWVGLGGAAAVHPGAVPWVYALARLACAAGLFYSLYAFAAGLGAMERVRWAAMVLGATASGLGWFALLLAPLVPKGMTLYCVDIGLSITGGVIADDLMMPETNTFASALLLPLFSFSMILLLWLVLWSWRALRDGDLKAALWAGLLGLLLGNVHTYDMIPMHLLWFTVGGCLLALKRLTWQGVKAYLVFAAVSIPSMLYQVYVFRTDPIFQEKAVTITASPPPLSYAVSFGIPLVLAIMGAVFVIRRREWQYLPVVCWLVVGIGVAYLPGLSFQRKMIEGAHLPMLILAALAVTRWLPSLGKRPSTATHPRRIRAAVAMVTLLCLPSSLYFLLGRSLATVTENNATRVASALMPPYSLSDGDVACAVWLRDEGQPGAVASMPMMGSYLPGLTGRKVWIGHWAETLRFEEKLASVSALLVAGDSDAAAPALTACQYVVVGEYERAFGASEARVVETAREAGWELAPAFRSGDSVVLEKMPR